MFTSLGRALVLIFIILWASGKNHIPQERYWVWAGYSTDDTPHSAVIYIYQGVWQHGTFIHKGIYPFPSPQKDIYLTYRIEGALPSPRKVASLFLSHRNHWQKHHIHVRGLQIDYDSPSRNLSEYLDFLTKIKHYLPHSLSLSITALCDWLISGDPKVLDHIGFLVQEIVFQLYHHYTYITPLSPYLKKLRDKKFPFALGILASSSPSKNIDDFLRHPYYLGVIKYGRRTPPT